MFSPAFGDHDLIFKVTEIITLYFRVPTVNMSPLTAETFNSVVMLVPPGVRTIVILVDQESRSKLLQDFAKAVHPYSR